MSRVALLGGSFNPPHLAHQMVCLWALSTEQADQVWLLPCNQHAFGKRLLSFERRFDMCELAAAPLPRGKVQVSTIEREIAGDGRTLITLRRLIADHPEHRFALLVGSDILQEKDSWYRFDEIERLVELLVVGRAGYPSPPYTVELSPISSTQIRELLAAGEDVGHLVPAAVCRYISAHALYAGRDE